MGKAVLENKELCEALLSYRVIAVPLSKERLNERGYNQAELLACGVAHDLELVYQENVLQKIRHTKRQSGIASAMARQENLKNAYRVAEHVAGENLILVDDIYTSGSTMNECARMLKEAGAGHIVGMCAAINRDFTMDDLKQSAKEIMPVW